LKLWLALFTYAPILVAQGTPTKKEIVSYTFSNSKSTPSEYTVQVNNDCRATFTSKGNGDDKELVEQPSDDEDVPAKSAKNLVPAREEKESPPKRFAMSAETCHEIFDLTRAANYFDGDFQFHKHRVAYTGDRILGYFAPGVSHKAAFTWSENPNVQRLAAIFEGTVASLVAAPKLESAYRFDKLGLNEMLKGLETQAQNGYLKEMQLLEPVLKQIAEDSKVMNIARQRAEKLLRLAEGSNR
jgi:hypothetical protein